MKKRKVVLYTNGDSRCNELKQKLITKNIEFTESSDFTMLKQYNIFNLPYVYIDNKVLVGYEDALDILEIR